MKKFLIEFECIDYYEWEFEAETEEAALEAADDLDKGVFIRERNENFEVISCKEVENEN